MANKISAMKNQSYFLLAGILFCLSYQNAQAQLHIQQDANITVTGTGQITLQNGNFVNNGTFNAGNGTVHCTGNTIQTFGGDSTTVFNHLTLDKTSGNVQLLRNVDVNGNLNFSAGNLDLNGFDCDLGTTGTIVGELDNKRFIGTSGEVVRTADLNAPNAANPGNIGLLITSDENLGTTILRRGHAPQTTGISDGIARYFSISPTNNMNLDATLGKLYFDGELNGNEETLLVPWRDGGTGYEAQGFSSRDASTNYVELTGISSFSSWTLAELECVISTVTCFFDGDGDGYGLTSRSMNFCDVCATGYSAQNGDCNDDDAAINPGETEICNDIDDDCNSMADDGLTFQDYYFDGDGDGYGAGSPMNECQSPGTGYVLQNGDCNDGDAAINPSETETCNGIDDDCDTYVDTDDPNFVDNTPPVPNCTSTTVQVGANGIYILQQSDVYLGGTDNCGTVNFEGMDPTGATCAAAGSTISVSVTVNDGNGNLATCQSIITVAGDLYPCCPPTHIIYVNENTPDDDDGSDWDNAFADLQSALELAGRCPIATEVWVASGTYFPTSGNDRTAAFVMQNSLTIYGGFDGGETSLSERDWTTNQAILNGDIGTPGVDGDNSYHVVFNNGNGINASAVLDGLTIKGGNANGMGDHEKGGGLFLKNASPVIRNCHFMGNKADFGGGMYCRATSAKVDSCTFSANSAIVGGAVQNTTDAATGFSSCSFIANSAANGGGAFHNITAMLCSITNCYFEGNSASGNGGAVLNIQSSPDLANSAFFANSAEEGAGISNLAGSSPNIVNCSFHANVAGSNGGAIRNHTGTVPLITNCIIWGNGTEVVNSVPGPIVSYSIIKQANGTYPDTGNMNEDPLFFGPADLRIMSCSPAVDAGSNAANGTAHDLAGNPREHNGNIDMDAYEFQGDPSLTSSTWTGAGNGIHWDDPANWSGGQVPDKCQDVLIPSGNSVTVPAGKWALGKTLEVENEAELVTSPAATLDISNE